MTVRFLPLTEHRTITEGAEHSLQKVPMEGNQAIVEWRSAPPPVQKCDTGVQFIFLMKKGESSISPPPLLTFHKQLGEHNKPPLNFPRHNFYTLFRSQVVL